MRTENHLSVVRVVRVFPIVALTKICSHRIGFIPDHPDHLADSSVNNAMKNRYECVRCGDDIRAEFDNNCRPDKDPPQYDMEACNDHIDAHGRLCAYCSHVLSEAE
jgi:hypothetical protein